MKITPSRYRAILVSSLIASTLLIGSLPAATNAATTRRVALGVSMFPNFGLSKLDAFTSSINGNRPAIWAIWSAWGDENAAFPTALAGGLRERGVVPMVNWLPVDSDNPDSSRYAYERIIAGDFDAYIREWATAARESGGTLMLRLMPEMNGRWFSWGVGRFDNTAAGFKQAWRHIWGIFRGPDGVGATNVRFLWSPNKPCSACVGYPEIYPGDDYVDYVGFSSFNWGSLKTWISMVKGYKGAVRRLAEVTSKPVIVAETASHDGGGDKAAWIRNGYPDVYEAYPRIAGIVYLNVDMTWYKSHPDWSLTEPPAALGAYADIAAKGKFKGTIP